MDSIFYWKPVKSLDQWYLCDDSKNPWCWMDSWQYIPEKHSHDFKWKETSVISCILFKISQDWRYSAQDAPVVHSILLDSRSTLWIFERLQIYSCRRLGKPSVLADVYQRPNSPLEIFISFVLVILPCSTLYQMNEKEQILSKLSALGNHPSLIPEIIKSKLPKYILKESLQL
jgi:hypothetical protein